MKLQLVHRSDYIFALEKAEDKLVLNAVVNENLEVITTKMVKWNLITHHLPLNNAPVIEGIELLPPLEDEADKLAKIKYPIFMLPYKTLGGNVYDTDVNSSLRLAYKEGYNKAKEDYKYTEEDMKKAIEKAWLMAQEEETVYSAKEKIIQSLSQPKLPTSFDTETKQYIY